jgi:hypothetical protein
MIWSDACCLRTLLVACIKLPASSCLHQAVCIKLPASSCLQQAACANIGAASMLAKQRSSPLIFVFLVAAGCVRGGHQG